MSILYGIIIGALIGLGIFAGGWLTLKLKSLPDWQVFKINPLQAPAENGEMEYPPAGQFKPFNMDDTKPKTAEGMAAQFAGRTSFHEDTLRDTQRK